MHAEPHCSSCLPIRKGLAQLGCGAHGVLPNEKGVVSTSAQHTAQRMAFKWIQHQEGVGLSASLSSRPLSAAFLQLFGDLNNPPTSMDAVDPIFALVAVNPLLAAVVLPVYFALSVWSTHRVVHFLRTWR